MKKIVYLSLALTLLSLTSCINIIEEIFLNKDGSGKYQVSIDMSSIMEDGGMRSLLKEYGGEEAQGADNPFAGDEPVEVDTMMYMKDAPDSVRLAFGNDKLLNKIVIHQQMSESKEIMRTDFILDFDKVSEIDEFLNNLDKLQSGDSPMGGGGGLLPKGNGSQKLFSMVKRTLTRMPANTNQEAMNEEELGMMEMMLGDATYTTIYHLPGKVKKTTIKDAKVDGNTITVEYPAMDIMKGKAKLDGLIKFGKK